jgi:hypothetical protein
MKRVIVIFIMMILATAELSLDGRLYASSPEAWKEFATDVEKACTRLAPEELRNFSITVSDYGSSSYGMAVLQDLQSGASGIYVCVYDKQTKKAELSGRMDLKKAKKIRKPQRTLPGKSII